MKGRERQRQVRYIDSDTSGLVGVTVKLGGVCLCCGRRRVLLIWEESV